MKTLNTLIKVFTALAAVAGIIYVVATYGEQIVAWAKKLLGCFPQCPTCETEETVESPAEEAAETPAAEETEEAPAEVTMVDVPVVEVTEEAPAEVAVAEHEPVAEDVDFAE